MGEADAQADRAGISQPNLAADDSEGVRVLPAPSSESPSAEAQPVRLAMAPRLENLAAVRRLLKRVALDAGLPAERVFDLQVAVSEACANAIEHGRQDADLELTVRRYSGRIEVGVFSQNEFRTEPLSQAERHEHRGMGLPLMAALSDHLALYSTGVGGTLVNLTFYLPGGPVGAATPLPPGQFELGQEHLLLSAIINSAPIEMFVLDPELRFRWANPSFLKRLEGEPPSPDLLGRTLSEVLPGIRTDPVLQVSRSGEAIAGQQRLAGESGKSGYWQYNALALRAPGQDPPFDVLILAQEVTALLEERARAESLARQAERGQAELQSVFSALTEAVVVYDARGAVVASNPAMVAAFGVRADGVHIRDIVARNQVRREGGELLGPGEMPAERAFRGEMVVREELLARDVHGQDRHVLISAGPIPGGRGIQGVVAVWNDVTEQRRAERELREREALNEALNELNRVISASLDEGDILQNLVRIGGQAIGAESTGIAIRQEGAWVPEYLYNLPGELARMVFTDEELPAATEVFRTQQAFVDNDYWANPLLEKSGRAAGVRSGLNVPLLVGQQFFAVLSFHHHGRPRSFSEPQIDFAKKLAASASLALQNARLYQAERSIAQNLQAALLTVPEEVEGLSLGHLYRSATKAARVGGDFYDLFTLKPGRVGLVIGDVCGHGVRAAWLASVVKETVRAYAYYADSPADVLGLVNESYFHRADVSGFTTVFFGLLDLDSGRLSYSSAGHPPPLIRRKDGTVLSLPGFSPPIGAWLPADFKLGETRLARGERLLLYTDGVTEARRRREIFGEERLERLLAESGGGEVRRLPGTIFRAVRYFSGGFLEDDLALLALDLG